MSKTMDGLKKNGLMILLPSDIPDLMNTGFNAGIAKIKKR